jgi:hypothetical protein
MKIRALGCGGITSRHPLIPTTFLVQSEGCQVLIGCPAQAPGKMESIGLKLSDVQIIVPLSSRLDQISGLYEFAVRSIRGDIAKPHLAGSASLLEKIEAKLGFYLHKAFEVTATRKLHLVEEHTEETVELVPGYLGSEPSYGAVFEQAEVFISGEVELNDEWIHRHGAGSKLILHSCRKNEEPIQDFPQAASIPELETLPVYLQQKIWLYGYDNDYQELIDPLPMLYLPQGQTLYDSERKAKHLDKERFIRENAKRTMGNAAQSK